MIKHRPRKRKEPPRKSVPCPHPFKGYRYNQYSTKNGTTRVELTKDNQVAFIMSRIKYLACVISERVIEPPEYVFPRDLNSSNEHPSNILIMTKKQYFEWFRDRFKRHEMVEQSCKNKQCGKVFLKNKTSKSVYCDIKCYQQDHPPKILTCKICGSGFRRSPLFRTYCSLECKSKDIRGKSKPK